MPAKKRTAKRTVKRAVKEKVFYTCACGKHNPKKMVDTPEFKKAFYDFLRNELKLPESRIAELTRYQGKSNVSTTGLHGGFTYLLK